MTTLPPDSTSADLRADALMRALREELRASGDLPAPLQPPPDTATPRASVETLHQMVTELQGRWRLTLTTAVSHRARAGFVLNRLYGRINGFINENFIAPHLQQQTDFNGGVVRLTQQVYHMLRVLQDESRYLREETREYDYHATTASRRLTQLELVVRQMADELANLRQNLPPANAADLAARLALLEAAVHNPAPRAPQGQTLPPPAPEVSIDYTAFAERFRGPESLVQERQQQYLAYFTGGPVLDLGCGRGEFLDLLRTAGVPARGIDSSPAMVAACSERGLDVVVGDLLAALGAADDASLAGVVALQVAEHLDSAAVVELFALAGRKLCPGGVLLVETINPQCIEALATNFAVDLTHQRPLHPNTAVFLAESAGLVDVQVQFTSPVAASHQLQPLPPVVTAPESWRRVLNENAERVNRLLFGYQDYAVIARKPTA